MSKKTGAGLAAYARAQLGRPYWWGTFGQTATASLLAAKRAQYPDYYQALDFPTQYGRKVHDCVGLIKGYLWTEGPEDGSPKYNPYQDVSVSGLYTHCTRKGTLGSIPDVPGVCVFMADMGHVGVYVGGGKTVEATGHARGVIESDLRTRGWSLWGMPEWIDYSEPAEPVSAPDTGAGSEPAAPQPEEPAPYTYKVALPLLRYGSRGGYVSAAQALLLARGYSVGGPHSSGREIPDGDYGPSTRNAVQLFQTRAGLLADGELGGDTWAALLKF